MDKRGPTYKGKTEEKGPKSFVRGKGGRGRSEQRNYGGIAPVLLGGIVAPDL